MVAAGRVVSGASTLTMQTVRLLQPQARTLGAKAVEAARALVLERRLDKRGILSLYLTLAPFGGNIEGVRAASLAYLGKEPVELSPAEAALLVAIPQAPERLRPDRHAEALRRARDRILERVAEAGVITPAAAAEARRDPVPAARRPMPMHAPHLTARLALAAAPGTATVRTTIDGGLQRRLEGMAARWADGLDPDTSVAAIVADAATGAVLAHLGSPGYFATRRAGQVDMTRAVRSPGSTLKPFLYGLAFDDGFLDPRSVVTDAPLRISGYAPANFAPMHLGELQAAEALRQSLNVPAVSILDRYGPARFVNRLASAGARLQLPGSAERPGLAVVLGGVGTTLEDMVSLYTALAGDGRVRPLAVRADAAGTHSRPLLTAGSAWEVARILESSAHPAHGVARRGGPVAWKTGTSYGFRDAWALGVADGRVVGVWVGRPDGTPRPGHYGARSAAPLLLEVFDTLPRAPRLAAPLPGGRRGAALGPAAAAGAGVLPGARRRASRRADPDRLPARRQRDRSTGRSADRAARLGRAAAPGLAGRRAAGPGAAAPPRHRLAPRRRRLRDGDGDRRRRVVGPGPVQTALKLSCLTSAFRSMNSGAKPTPRAGRANPTPGSATTNDAHQEHATGGTFQ